MSLHEYVISNKLTREDLPFYALIMAAMRKADDVNSFKLRAVFPEVWEELSVRYNAPGGYLPEEVPKDEETP
jgi:hypothetical protein